MSLSLSPTLPLVERQDFFVLVHIQELLFPPLLFSRWLPVFSATPRSWHRVLARCLLFLFTVRSVLLLSDLFQLPSCIDLMFAFFSIAIRQLDTRSAGG